MKVLVVGSLKNASSHPELCASFVAKLGELIVERGHTLLHGCCGSFDKAVAEAADARLNAFVIKSEPRLAGYRLKEVEPVHRPSGVSDKNIGSFFS